MFIQRFPTYPLKKKSEVVFMFDISEDVMAQTALFISRRNNECEQRLLELQALLRKGSHLYDGNDHKHLSVTKETRFQDPSPTVKTSSFSQPPPKIA